MKVYSVLCAFAHDEKVGGYVLTDGKQLPILEIKPDEKKDSLALARYLLYLTTKIDPNWPLYCYQHLFYEPSNKKDEGYVVYGSYFSDLNKLTSGWEWTKIEDTDKLDPLCRDIIRLSAIKRY